MLTKKQIVIWPCILPIPLDYESRKLHEYIYIKKFSDNAHKNQGLVVFNNCTAFI
jgi:hypothetical protein